jgi:hypothetical protein
MALPCARLKPLILAMRLQPQASPARGNVARALDFDAECQELIHVIVAADVKNDAVGAPVAQARAGRLRLLDRVDVVVFLRQQVRPSGRGRRYRR